MAIDEKLLRKYGTRSVLGGVNVQPGLELLRIREEQKRQDQRRQEFAQSRADKMGLSAVDTAFRTRAEQRDIEGQDWLRGFRGKELEERIASRKADDERQSGALKSQQAAAEASRSLAERNVALGERTEDRIAGAYDDAQQRRTKDQEVAAWADTTLGGAIKLYSDMPREALDAIPDDEFRRTIAGYVTKNIDPNDPDFNAKVTVINEKLDAAVEKRRADRDEQMRRSKQAEYEADKDADREEREKGKAEARKLTRYKIVTGRLDKLDSRIDDLQTRLAGLVATYPDRDFSALEEQIADMTKQRDALQSEATELEDSLTKGWSNGWPESDDAAREHTDPSSLDGSLPYGG